MRNKKSLLVIVVLSVLILISGYFLVTYHQEYRHQSYDLGIITLNTTNTTNLTCEENETGFLRYGDYSGKYTITIISYDNMSDSKASEYKRRVSNDKNKPSRDVDGIVVYTTTANIGDYVGETRYGAMIENNDLNVVVDICTPDINETVYIAKNTRFN